MLRIKPAAHAFADLNAAQLRAVEAGDDPLLVIAGAGSGKTKTLAARVARLAHDGADPSRILLLTFSRRAADEMVKRVGAVAAAELGLSDQIVLPWSGTFHAVGARLLREFAPVIGLDSAFTIHDRSDSADLMGMVRNELGFSKTAKRFPAKGTCLAIYSNALNSDCELGAVLAATFPWCRQWQDELGQVFEAYVAAKQSQNVLDYDDLLFYWAGLMDDASLAREVGAKFDYVLIDEFQDTNKLQARIVLALKPEGRGLTVVGDDAQSIYSFRAATVRNILDFPKAFAPPAAIVTLEQNYRSTPPILAASNAVIDLAAERFTKNLQATRGGGERPKLVSVRDEADQARYVCEHVLEAREEGVDLKQQAVLFRASDASAQLELELARRDIPFVKFGGLKFLEAAHVKDMIALLRWLENASDRLAGFRVLQRIAGIGPARAGRLLDDVAARGQLWVMETAPAPEAGAEAWSGLVDLVRRAANAKAWPGHLDAAVAWYLPVLEAHYDDAHVRRGDIEQLLTIGSTSASAQAFLTDLTLDPPNATSDEAAPPHRDDDFLILSTIHSAKGQEWKRVFVLNAVDGCIPADLGVGSQADIEEERRLLYVAMTRAKDDLHIITPQRFYVQNQSKRGDKNVFAIRTRFIPSSILPAFNQVAWTPPSARDAEARASGPLKPIDLAARARGRWSRS
jgi:DNA helicase-2/ATP-dependent DNA helicase PcrA